MKEYKDFFEKMKKFKKEQNKQKQRGLNDYNILTTVLKYHDEVRVHSRMINSLLNIDGSHYQNTLFLDKFLEELGIEKYNSSKSEIYLEYENIDIYLTDGKKHIIIENKIWASDQERQIERYIDIIRAEYENIEADDLYVIYLSPNRSVPSDKSLGRFKIDRGFIIDKSDNVAHYMAVYYQTHIIAWLEKCQYEVQNISNLNEVLKLYIDVVKMVNNTYKSKVKTMDEIILASEENYEIAMEMQSSIPKMREEIITSFFGKIVPRLESELGKEWRIELKDNLPKSGVKNLLKIYKKKWRNADFDNIIFAFAFNKNDYYDGFVGVVKNGKKANIIQDISTEFKNDLEKLGRELDSTDFWLDSEWLPDIEGADDFVKYIKFEKNTEEEFIKGITNFINLFESKNNPLMTKMNTYLNEKI